MLLLAIVATEYRAIAARPSAHELCAAATRLGDNLPARLREMGLRRSRDGEGAGSAPCDGGALMTDLAAVRADVPSVRPISGSDW